MNTTTATKLLNGEICLWCLKKLTIKNRREDRWGGEWRPNYKEEMCKHCEETIFLEWDGEDELQMPYYVMAVKLITDR